LSRTWWDRVDHLQAVLTLLLLGIGLASVYSASPADFDHQVVWALLGLVAYAGAAAFDYRRLRAVAVPLYAGCLLLLLAVHFAGHTALGARRWISLAGVPIEPSEISKLAVLVTLAAFFDQRPRPSLAATLTGCVLVAAPVLLVLSQPDLGTAIVLASILLGALFFAGAPRLHLAGLVGLGALAVPILPAVLRGYQRRRLEIFLNPSSDPLGAGYNLAQARIAVGSGGVFGQGWLHGSQGRLGFIPERSTDFVFAVYAEQFGLAGALLLIGLFSVLLLRLARTAAAAGDRFGYLLAGGVAVMLLVQVIENVGMNIGLTPIAGIPLPLISYGGSALLTDLCALGLAQSVMLRRRAVIHVEAKPVAYNLGPCPSQTVR
jgi:rod shape determining protein RodA